MARSKVSWLLPALGLGFGISFVACQSPSDSCVAGSDACTCTEAGQCDPGLECMDGVCVSSSADEAGDDPPPPDEDCGETLPLVSGSIATSVTTMEFDSVTATVNHKQDIDQSEDGCINRIELEFKRGSGCTFTVSASTLLQANTLRIDSISLTADSQCPDFLDTDEGNYLGGLADVEGSVIELSQTKIGEENVAESCFAGTLKVRPAGMISDGDKILSSLGGELVVTGDFPTSQLNMGCPVECMVDADCGGNETCEGGSCEPIGGTTEGDSTSTSTSTTTDPDTSSTTTETTAANTACEMDVSFEILAVDATAVDGWDPAMSMLGEGMVMAWDQQTQDATLGWDIDVPCDDTWHIWVRGTDQGPADSYFATVDGQPDPSPIFELDCTNNPQQSTYVWKELNYRDQTDPSCTYQFDPWTQDWLVGIHQFQLMYRDSVGVSKLWITNTDQPPP